MTYLGERVRVIECKHDIQWILQHRKSSPDSWRGVHFCRTCKALIRVCGFTETTAPTEPASLPELYGGVKRDAQNAPPADRVRAA